MDLSTTANIAEILSGIFVIVSMIVIVFELRENNQLQKVSAFHRVLEQSIQAQFAMTTRREFNEAMVAAQKGEPDPVSVSILNNWMSATFSTFWQVHYYYKEGVLEKEVDDAYERRQLDALQYEGVCDWWTSNGFRYPVSFQNKITAIMSEGT